MRGKAAAALALLLGHDGASQTSVTLTKSGSDIVFSGVGGAPNYLLFKSDIDPQFRLPQRLELPNPSLPSYTYVGATNNGVPLQFFDLTGSGEGNRGTTYTGGAIPPPFPTIATVANAGGQTTGLRVGDLVKFTGTGYSMVGEEDVVHFPQGIAVKALTGAACTSPCTPPTTTTFWVRIPRSALTGLVRVQVGHQVSDPYTLVVYMQTGLTNLSSVMFQPVTGSVTGNVLATARFTAANPSRIYQLKFDGTAWPATPLHTAPNNTQKFNGGQGFDFTGRWYIGLTNVTAGGETRAVNAVPDPPGYLGEWARVFPFSGPGSQNVEILAVAASPLYVAGSAEQAFFMFRNNTTPNGGGVWRHIRRTGSCTPTPCIGSVLDPDYGNFGATNLNINTSQFAGMAVDLNGGLFLTETNRVQWIEASEASRNVVVSGFTLATGIAHAQVDTGDPGTLLVADTTAGTLYKVDLDGTAAPVTGERTAIATGLGAPRAATFAATPLASAACSRLLNKDLSFIIVGETSAIRQYPDPRLTITPDAPTRVWISKWRTGDAYPSVHQIADHTIRITAKVSPKPPNPRLVYFRVVDPPDLSGYAAAPSGAWCDNADPNPLSGTFQGTGTPFASALTDDEGQASVVLNTSDSYAGDNWIVQASFANLGSASAPAIVQTATITAWKRAYIEKDRMFREGGLLAADAAPNDAVITVHDWAQFPGGLPPVCMAGTGCTDTPGGPPCFALAIFDATNTYEGAHDEAYVGWITCPGGGLLDLHLTDASGASPYQLALGYASSPYPDFVSGTPETLTGKLAGVGIPGAFYESNANDQWEAYDDGYLELSFPSDGVSAVPYLPQSFFDLQGTQGAIDRARAHQFWFMSKTPLTPPNEHINDPHNHFHLVGASSQANFGLTTPDSDVSWVFVGKIEGVVGCDPTCQRNVNISTTLHEGLHQYRVNGAAPCTLYHDPGAPTTSNDAWCGDPGGTCANAVLGETRCLLSGATAPPQFEHDKDDINRLECEDLGAHPASACPLPDCGAGFRSQTDPQ